MMQLHIKDVYKTFGNKEVLKGSTHTFESGKIIGLLGLNGSGKTTLFHIVYGDLMKDSGSVALEENGAICELGVMDVGMVFSENYLPDFMTGYEFVTFYLAIHGTNSDKTVEDYLRFMAIDENDWHTLIKGYSDGMKSKLSLICIFISQPKVILLDEPLTAVDVVSSIEIKKLLKVLKKDRIVLLSTHIMQLAEDLCDEIVVLHDGKLQKLEVLDHTQLETTLVDLLKGGESHE